MRAIYITLTLLIIAICTSSFAQTGSIKGRVNTHDGIPAPFVSVIIKGTNKAAVSDDSGVFLLKNLKEGTYTLITSFVGLAAQEKSVTVTANQTTAINFELMESAEQLAEIEVTAQRGLNEKNTSLGKVAINPMDLPQSVMVIDHAVLERQQALHISDVLMNTNGVYVMGTTGGTQEEIAGRGFAYGSNNTFKNGIRYNNGVMPEMSSLERVEVIKGSNAILFGQVGAGGVLNLVTKKPKFQQGGELSMRMGSYDFYKPSLDFYGAINNSEHVAYRVNASYENARSFRDNVKSERIYFNPSFLIKAGRKTDILIEGDFLKDARTLDFGIAAVNYVIAGLPRGRYLNTAWAYYKAEQKSTTATVTHHLNNNWQVKVIGSYQGYDQDQYGTTRPNGSGNMVKDDGTWTRGLQRSGTEQKYYIAQADLTGKINTGAVEHTLLVGADIDRYANNTLTYAYTNPAMGNKNIYDTINIFDPARYAQRTDIPTIALGSITKNPVNRVGVYIQDMASISENIKVLAGIRYSYIDTRSKIYNKKVNSNELVLGDSSESFSGAFTPRLGVVYKPIPQTSIFASYANSFELNTGTDNTKRALPPSIINQYEAGIKNELFKGVLSANITFYKIVNSNFAQTITVNSTNYNENLPAAKELAGEVKSRGIEVDLMGKAYHGISIIAGYSYNDTRYTKSNTFVVNSRLRYNPQHTGNMSIYYTLEEGFAKGFTIGFTSLYVGERVAGRSTRVTVKDDAYKLMAIPNYFQFDLSAGYTLKNISLRIKVSNLLNEMSYNVHDDNSVNPIAPRQFSATVSHKF